MNYKNTNFKNRNFIKMDGGIPPKCTFSAHRCSCSELQIKCQYDSDSTPFTHRAIERVTPIGGNGVHFMYRERDREWEGASECEHTVQLQRNKPPLKKGEKSYNEKGDKLTNSQIHCWSYIDWVNRPHGLKPHGQSPSHWYFSNFTYSLSAEIDVF